MSSRVGLLLMGAAFLAGCTAATVEGNGSSPGPTLSPAASTTIATAAGASAVAPTPLPSPNVAATASPTPTPGSSLPAEPVLLATTTSAESVIYNISVAPLLQPMDKAAAEARATRIGTLVKLGKPRDVYQLTDGDHWHASWDSSIQDIPIDPAFDGIRLEMHADGTVVDFVRIVGPLAPKPGHIITKAQALKAAGATKAPDTAELVWSFKPNGSGQLRLVWYLDWQNLQPDGEKWPCVVYLDAGTAEELFSGCVS